MRLLFCHASLWVQADLDRRDLFLPLVNLHLDENWQPNGLGREIYAMFHSMVGWILVPLLLASLSGIVRRD